MERPRPPGEDRRSVSERVVDAVAEAEGLHALELPTPLYDTVDPDALDSLFGSRDASVVVTFRYCGHDVTVSRGGEVSVDPADASTPSEGDASMATSSGEVGGAGRERRS